MQPNEARPSRNKTVVVAILITVGLVVGIGWTIFSLWKHTGILDSGPTRGGLAEQKMHRKSVVLQQIMDALVRDDFNGVANAAEEMKRIGTHAQWYLGEEHYGDHSDQFRISAERLIESANIRDYKAAAEAYDVLATSCIECHRLRLDKTGALTRNEMTVEQVETDSR